MTTRVPAPRRRATREMLTKVPEATAMFWIVKILTTGFGETASDWLGRSAFPVLAVGGAAVLLVASLWLQLRGDRYRPAVYWFAVVMVSVFGTMAADGWHVGLGVSYVVSTTGLAVLLAAVLTAWYLVEGTLSIHHVTTPRRERFYWATVITTFALGTAAGDMLASALHLGYWRPGVLFAVLIVLPGVAFWKLHLNAVAAFWTAYVLTRPLGASFTDWAAVSPRHHGLGFGSGPVTLFVGVLIALALGVPALLRGGLRSDFALRRRAAAELDADAA